MNKKKLIPGVAGGVVKPLPTLLSSKNDDVNHQWLKRPKTFTINVKISFLRKPSSYAIDEKVRLFI